MYREYDQHGLDRVFLDKSLFQFFDWRPEGGYTGARSSFMFNSKDGGSLISFFHKGYSYKTRLVRLNGTGTHGTIPAKYNPLMQGGGNGSSQTVKIPGKPSLCDPQSVGIRRESHFRGKKQREGMPRPHSCSTPRLIYPGVGDLVIRTWRSESSSRLGDVLAAKREALGLVLASEAHNRRVACDNKLLDYVDENTVCSVLVKRKHNCMSGF